VWDPVRVLAGVAVGPRLNDAKRFLRHDLNGKGGCGFVGTRHHLLHIRYVLRRATAKQTTKYNEGKSLLAPGTEQIEHVKSLNRAKIDQDSLKFLTFRDFPFCP
jgi:hypothetical protein